MAAARKPSDPIALQVRMTEAFRRQLANAADKSGRSLNAEILWRLGQTFGEEWRDRELKELMSDPKFIARLAEAVAKRTKGGEQ